MYNLFYHKLGLSKNSAGFCTVIAGILIGTLAGGLIGAAAGIGMGFYETLPAAGAAGAILGCLVSYIHLLNV